MTSKTWQPGTVIDSPWLQDVNDLTYGIGDASDVTKGDADVAVKREATGAVARTQHAINEERTVSITDFGGQEGLSFNNTTAFNACLTALGAMGGVIRFPVGNWRGNFVVNQHNVIIEGCGGVGELLVSDPAAVGLRPWNTGAGTTTLRISNGTRVNRKCGIRNIVISGDDGSGNQAENALWLDGGTVNFHSFNYDLMDGLCSLRIDPNASTFPATVLKLGQGSIRNDSTDPASRAIYIRKYSDADGYVTDLYFNNLKINKPSAGYWLEVDGTGSTGLVVHFSQTYLDTGAGRGILSSASGLETIECDGGLQVDAGAANTIVWKKQDNVKDPTRFWRGHIEGVGGQRIEFLDTTTMTFPLEPGIISFQPLFREPFVITPVYFSNANDAYNETTCPYLDQDTSTGPITLNRGDWSIKTAGKGLRVKEDANGKQGLSAQMVAGALTIANTSVTANSRIFITRVGTGVNWGAVSLETQTAGVGFTVRSTNAADTARVAWQIFEPA